MLSSSMVIPFYKPCCSVACFFRIIECFSACYANSDVQNRQIRVIYFVQNINNKKCAKNILHIKIMRAIMHLQNKNTKIHTVMEGII